MYIDWSKVAMLAMALISTFWGIELIVHKVVWRQDAKPIQNLHVRVVIAMAILCWLIFYVMNNETASFKIQLPMEEHENRIHRNHEYNI